MKRIFFAGLFSVAVVVAAQDSEASYSDLLAAGAKEKEARIEALAAIVRAPNDTKIDVAMPGQAPQKIYCNEARKKDAAALIEAMKGDKEWLPTLKMEPGSAGVLRKEGSRFGETSEDAPTVKSVIDANSLYVNDCYGWHLIEGVSTANMADGQRLKPGAVYSFVGAKKFLPPGGKTERTVFVIRPLDIEKAKRQQAQSVQAKEALEKKYSVFELKDGRVVWAEMVAQDGDTFIVRADNGQTVKFKAEDVSERTEKTKPSHAASSP